MCDFLGVLIFEIVLEFFTILIIHDKENCAHTITFVTIFTTWLGNKLLCLIMENNFFVDINQLITIYYMIPSILVPNFLSKITS